MHKNPLSLLQFSLRELGLNNYYLMLKLKRFRLPILIFKSLHFRMEPSSEIIHEGGRLYLGCRWGFSRSKESELKIGGNGKLKIRGYMKIYTGCWIDICSGASLSLGSGFINNNARIAVFKEVTIGNNVFISENFTLRDSDNHKIIGSKNPVSAPISIEDNVWIGINVTILKGVTVGEGAVIAANSLVNKDVPPRSLVGGIPAKVLKENVSWE